MAEERGGNEGENVHRFASPVPVCPNSTLRSVSPFDQLVAALDDDSIVGTDDPDYPLTRDALAGCVSQPDYMRRVVKDQFRLRASNKKLDAETVQKLCSKAIRALHIRECSQHEPALVWPVLSLPSLLVGVCRPACLLFVVAVSLRRSCHREWCLAILRLLPPQTKQVRGGYVVARVVVVCAHHTQAVD